MLGMLSWSLGVLAVVLIAGAIFVKKVLLKQDVLRGARYIPPGTSSYFSDFLILDRSNADVHS